MSTARVVLEDLNPHYTKGNADPPRSVIRNRSATKNPRPAPCDKGHAIGCSITNWSG